MATHEEISIEKLRQAMLVTISAHAVETGDLTGRPVIGEPVLEAMSEVPRHEFMPEDVQPLAYEDCPLPIGHNKTISQPFIVALMIDLLDIDQDDRVLEIGTGLGYQAAVLSRLASEVYSVDIIPGLSDGAEHVINKLGYNNVQLRTANGAFGWKDKAPFDKIIVAAAANEVPDALIEQLVPGGRLIIPVGPGDSQNLTLVQKGESSVHKDDILPVRFSRLETAH